MKHALALALVTAATLAGTAHAVDVYKWKDSKGVVHYGDRPASGAGAALLNVAGTDLSEDEEAQAVERLDQARSKLLEPGDDDSIGAMRASHATKAPATGCTESWRRYDEATACFAAHRRANGKGVTDAGAAVCKQVAQPACAR